MKKSTYLPERLPVCKMGFLSFLWALLFFACIQTEMKAQAPIYVTDPTGPVPIQKTLFQLPAGNFVSVEVAKIRLTDALLVLKAQMEQYGQGTPQYEAAYRRYIYYIEILTNLNAGKGVAESIALSLGRLMISDAPPALATPEQALVEKNAAINLLS